MKKYEVICFINSAGINYRIDNFEDTVMSIYNNINTFFSFYIVTDSEDRKKEIIEIFIKNNLNNFLLELVVSGNSWANNFNDFYKKFNSYCEYILLSHDDLIVRTFDFFNITKKEIEGMEDEIGWIGYTSDCYYRLHGNPVAQSAREIFCKDRTSWPKLYELHKMTNGYNESLLDYPNRACKVPGIYPHFNLIKSTNLEKIGLCPNWGHYTLLIDEHWSLKTLINNMWTVWVPSVFYDHPIRGELRINKEIQNPISVHHEFLKEWGYNYLTELTDETIKKVCNNFPNTNISFFNDKNTFDYIYLKN